LGERLGSFGDDALSIVGLVREQLNGNAVGFDVVEQAPQDLGSCANAENRSDAQIRHRRLGERTKRGASRDLVAQRVLRPGPFRTGAHVDGRREGSPGAERFVRHPAKYVAEPNDRHEARVTDTPIERFVPKSRVAVPDRRSEYDQRLDVDCPLLVGSTPA
jgi:hypothetical protein